MKRLMMFVCFSGFLIQPAQAQETVFTFNDKNLATVVAVKSKVKANREFQVEASGLNWFKYSYSFDGVQRSLFNAVIADPLKELISTYSVPAPVALLSAGSESYMYARDALKADLDTGKLLLAKLDVAVLNVDECLLKIYGDADDLSGASTSLRTIKDRVQAAKKEDGQTEVRSAKQQIEERVASIESNKRLLDSLLTSLGETDKAKLEPNHKEFTFAATEAVASLKVLAAAWGTGETTINSLSDKLVEALNIETQTYKLKATQDSYALRVTMTPTEAYKAWVKSHSPGAIDPKPIVVSSDFITVYGRSAIDSSVGFLMTNLRTPKYYKDSKNILTKNTSDISDLAPALFVTYLPDTLNLFNNSASLGVTIGVAKDSKNPAYFVGFTCVLGRESRLALTAGWAYKSVLRLNDGQSVGTDIGSAMPATDSVTRQGTGFGLSIKVQI
jgi:hypothetical protein